MSEYTIEGDETMRWDVIASEPGTTAVIERELVEPVVLMDRTTAGILVELVLVEDELDIRVTVAGDVESARIPRDKGLDAFDHPYIYLPRS